MVANGSFCSNGEKRDEGTWKREMTLDGGRILPTWSVASPYEGVAVSLRGGFGFPTWSERWRWRGGWVLGLVMGRRQECRRTGHGTGGRAGARPSQGVEAVAVNCDPPG